MTSLDKKDNLQNTTNKKTKIKDEKEKKRTHRKNISCERTEDKTTPKKDKKKKKSYKKKEQTSIKTKDNDNNKRYKKKKKKKDDNKIRVKKHEYKTIQKLVEL